MFMILDTDEINFYENQKLVEIKCPLCSYLQITDVEDIEHLLSCPKCHTFFIVKQKKGQMLTTNNVYELVIDFIEKY